MKNKTIKQYEKIIGYRNMTIDLLKDEIRYKKGLVRYLQIVCLVLILLLAVTNIYHIWNFDNFANKVIKPVKIVKRVDK